MNYWSLKVISLAFMLAVIFGSIFDFVQELYMSGIILIIVFLNYLSDKVRD